MNQNAIASREPLQPFARLIGDWKLTHRDLATKKEWSGRDTFAWLPGGHFLAFHHHEDGNGGIDGIMIIGQEMGWEETEPGSEIVGHWFESSSGHHYTYIWEIDGNTLQFWLNNRQSDMFFKGEFSKDDTTISGTWKWPGGGYDLVMQRTVE